MARASSRAVDRRLAAEMSCEGLQPQVPHLVPHQTPSQPGSVDRVIAQGRVAVKRGCCIEERHVEADVVPDDDRVTDEFEEGGKSSGDVGRLDHHRLGDAGQDRDQRRYGRPGSTSV